MLTINSHKRIDPIVLASRARDFLRIGSLAMGGLALPQLLKAEANTGRRSHKAVIMIYLPVVRRIKIHMT